MGLFVVPEGDTVEDKLNAAIANIKLYMTIRGTGEGYEYLLEDFATSCIKQALEQVKHEDPHGA